MSEFSPRPAKNLVVELRGVPVRVWHAGPNRGGVWLIRPDGSMKWFDSDEVHAMAVASEALARNAFPAAE